MSKITLDNLSDNLKAYLEGLGLTEEQVLNLINENGLDEEELKAMLKDTMSINELATNSKTVIGAINELFQDVDNGKNLIATSIGNPLITGNSTFSAMSEAILGLRREGENETDAREVLYNMMIEDGYNSATSSMTVDELIDLLDRSGIEIDDIKQIACAYQHTFILKKDGSLWATGDNASGQLGLGDNTDRKTFTKVTKNINKDVKQVACGQYYTFIIKNDGSVWSCGTGGDGQLGLGDDFSRNTFTKVTKNINNDVKQVACGSIFTFILKNDGSIWACGANGTGQLGFGNGNSRKTFLQVTTNINNDVKQIACGEKHTFILKNDGSVWSCGYNEFGQLGLNNTNSKDTFTQVTKNINNDVKQISCGDNHTVILKNDGSVWSCGKNEFGQLGLNNTTKRNTFTQVTTNINNDVKEIACGNYHTFILKNDGSIWACGNNEFGQLGLNDTTDKYTFTQVTTNINNDVKEVVCGGNYTFIVKTTGSVWACGYNNYGQLGLNNTTKITTFTSTNFSTGLSEYDIDRIALYNYLLSNEIPVTEDMDIGTMLDLLVDDYINNMILGYENNLKIILTDEGVSVTEEDDMDSLITKVDNEFDRKNTEMENSGGLDIISATELPATGKENQICVITDKPDNKIVVVTSLSDIDHSTNNIYIYLGSADSNSHNTGKTYDCDSGNFTFKFYIVKIYQNNKNLASYIYQNGTWVEYTYDYVYFIENGVLTNPEIFGTLVSGNAMVETSTAVYICSPKDSGGYPYHIGTTNKKIDFSLYNYIEVVGYHKSSSEAITMMCYDSPRNGHFESYVSPVNYAYSSGSFTTTSSVQIYDIRSWTSTGYLGFECTTQEGNHYIYITDVRLR